MSIVIIKFWIKCWKKSEKTAQLKKKIGYCIPNLVKYMTVKDNYIYNHSSNPGHT